jgi:hypothetical protein
VRGSAASLGNRAPEHEGSDVTDKVVPPGRELAWSNRRLLAESLHWPPDALEACEQIEAAHPAWQVTWMSAYGRRAAGFYATRDGHGHKERDTHGADPEALATAIEAVVSCCPECGWRILEPAGSDLSPHDIPGTAERCAVGWSRGSVPVRSRCPACASVLDVRAGSEVPPHQVDGEWCRTQGSQRTV